jgi:hypothetical protein
MDTAELVKLAYGGLELDGIQEQDTAIVEFNDGCAIADSDEVTVAKGCEAVERR